MDKVSKVKRMIGNGVVVDGSISRDQLDRVTYQSFTGLELLIDGENIVFAGLRRQSTLSESMIEQIDERSITFRLKDEDGPFKLKVVLRAPE